MRCKLCLLNKNISRSNIIPEFFFKPLYDKLHRADLVRFEKPDKFVQQGIKEKLQCADGESKIAKYEDHVRRVFYGGDQFLFQGKGNKVIIKGIAYTKFKLFQLSVLWMASISNHNFYGAVKLRPHEER